MTTYYAFGDTGGHYRQLLTGLEKIGFDKETHKLPEGVVVIHCGDLIHKGPSSTAVVTLVDKILRANPGQWIQLLGNHEFNYVHGAPFFWQDFIDIPSQEKLAAWLEEDLVKVAYAITEPVKFHNLSKSARAYPTPNKPVIFTHAGITYGFWDIILNKKQDVAAIAEKINTLPIKTVTKPGIMLGAGAGRWPVAPTWAAGIEEVWQSWKNVEEIPFIQVHGHTTPYSYSYSRWWNAPKDFREASKVNPDRRTTTTRVGDSLQIAIDPGYSKDAPESPQPALKMTSETS